jgi:hypothetical protein
MLPQSLFERHREGRISTQMKEEDARKTRRWFGVAHFL